MMSLLPALGQLSLIIALLVSVTQAISSLYGSWRQRPHLLRLSRPLAYSQLFFVGLSFGFLMLCLLNDDFTVKYVFENSSTTLPWYYKLCAAWGGHEGSILLWVFILSLWTAAVALFSQQLALVSVSRVLGILGILATGFLLYILMTSSPFMQIILPPSFHSQDLNPLLQDPGLISHPPILYMGYVGFSVAYAFAISALMSGRLDNDWIRWIRPWTLIAWSFLTCGIVLGSWWSYRELGWGGWWFWDPVENASFMPWLMGTALIHSLSVAEKRNTFKAWTILLAISAFSLSLMGTFLVRSGILVSIHSFAIDPSRGTFILIFLAVVILSSLALYGYRSTTLQSVGRFSLWSRETLLLVNNIILLSMLFAVLLGTLYPLLSQTFGWGKVSIGAPYFNTMMAPMGVLALLLMGIAPHLNWKHEAFKKDITKHLVILIIALSLGTLLMLLYTRTFTPGVTTGVGLALWVIMSTLHLVIKTKRFTTKIVGMILAHLGVAVCAIGIVISMHYTTEKNVYMHVGDTTTLASNRFHFGPVGFYKGPNYAAETFTITRFDKQQASDQLHPELRLYRADNELLKKTAVDVDAFRDLYVAVGRPVKNLGWPVHLSNQPFIRWIWLGGLLMALGGLIGLFDKRTRTQKR